MLIVENFPSRIIPNGKKNLESKNRHSSSFQTKLNKDEAMYNQLLFSVGNLHLGIGIQRHVCDRNKIR